MMKLLTLTATFMAAAAWVTLLVWHLLMVREIWQYSYPTPDDIPAIVISLVGLLGTVMVAWRAYPKSVSAVLMWSCASLGVALFLLLVTSIGGGGI